MNITANRFQSAERIEITRRVQASIAQWGPTYVGRWDDVPALERVAMHAIGCDARDLRDSELAEIKATVLFELRLDRRISNTADRRREIRDSIGRRCTDECKPNVCIHRQDQDREEYLAAQTPTTKEGTK